MDDHHNNNHRRLLARSSAPSRVSHGLCALATLQVHCSIGDGTQGPPRKLFLSSTYRVLRETPFSYGHELEAALARSSMLRGQTTSVGDSGFRSFVHFTVAVAEDDV